MADYEFHPFASVLPMLSPIEINELAADIQGNGLRSEIVLLDGKILDGRNRYKACLIANVEPRFKDFNGDGDPIDYIVSVNVKRRHLTASQKAMVVAKILDLPRGNPKLKSSKNPTNPKSAQNAELETAAGAAKRIDVSQRTVEQAKEVLKHAPSSIIKEVERGEKSVSSAVKEIKKEKEPKPTQIPLDKTGYPIPDSVSEDWKRAVTQRSLLNQISDIRSIVKTALEEKDLVFAEVNNTTVADLNNAYSGLKNLIPYAVCTSCQGKQKTKCALCRGRGFISEFAYLHFVPAETRTLREKMRAK